MIRPVVKNELALRAPSSPATVADRSVGQDLLDTLRFHSHECVGMAANMIGVAKRIIVFDDAGTHRLMYNPEITAKSEPYQTEEGCLSLSGRRPATRYRRIEVTFRDERFASRTETFEGWTAQIIQHEIDHCNGIVI